MAPGPLYGGLTAARLGDAQAADLARIFKALGDPVRLAAFLITVRISEAPP
ncbi:hypothetical protein PV682_15045 [Streptomyces niveiscabiei]|uniref:hypothetical protein n=1 Tax=Streptomyces niveiscabiei TaxID=164115 RepID=UPI0029BE302E|nr:hypothetical protein [Streptomyces niveiscabiei]MDX3382777.1 hypothetical protein [Streptomyces niveiscabiei]